MSRKVLNVFCVGGNESLVLPNMRVAVRKKYPRTKSTRYYATWTK